MSIVSHYGLSFNASNFDNVDCGSGSSLAITGSVTLAAFVKSNGATNGGVAEHYNAGVGYRIVFAAGGHAFFSVGDGSNFDQVLSSFTINDNIWHHVAGVYDGSTIKIYIDGLLNASDNYTHPPADSGTNFIIGDSSDQGFLNSSIDEVRVYNRALSATEVAQLSAGININDSALKGYWAFEEGSGTTANDSSGNSNTGTITGATYTSSVSAQLLYPNLVATVSANSTDTNNVTTQPVDTTGANRIILSIAYYTAVGVPTISDSKSNSYVKLTQHDGNNVGNVLYDCQNPAVGISHTFSALSSGSAIYPSISVIAVNGADTSSAVDQQNGNTGNSLSSIQPGSITPGQNNEIVVSGLSSSVPEAFALINSNFCLGAQSPFVSSLSWGNAIAYLVQTTASAVNPTWTPNATTELATSIASFKTSTAGHIKSALGVAKAHIKSIFGVPIAHVKSFMGVPNI